MEYISRSAKETMALGEKIAASLKGGDVVCLYGELGAGKTTLVKGMARGLGVKEKITSPTFVLLNVYNIQYPIFNIQYFVHIDTYRLKEARELVEIGVEDYLGEPNTVCVVEWAEKVEPLLKDKHIINIYLRHAEGGRAIEVKN